MFKFASSVAYKKQKATAPVRAEYEYLLKFLLIGDAGVGKSCVVLRFADDNYFPESYISTIGVDFKIKTVDIDGTTVKCQIWDTTGQERFRTITSSYYRGAHGVLLIYDVTDQESYSHIRRWRDEVQRYAPENTPMIVLGNKCDLERERQAVDYDNAEEEFGLPHMLCSARTGDGINEAFLTLGRACLEKIAVGTRKPVKLSVTAAAADAALSSDEESFSEDELEVSVAQRRIAKSRNPSAKQKDKKKHLKIDVNVCQLDLRTLTEASAVATGDPVSCSTCNAVMSSMSRQNVTKDPKGLLKARQATRAANAVRAKASAARAKALRDEARKKKERTRQSQAASPPGGKPLEDRNVFDSIGNFFSGWGSYFKATPEAREQEKAGQKEEEEKETNEVGVSREGGGPDRDQVDENGKDDQDDQGDKADKDDDEDDKDDEDEDEEDEEDEDEEDEEDDKDQLYWVCEFCDSLVKLDDDLEIEEIPSSNTVDYLMEAPPAAVAGQDKVEPNLVFVIDISGSMCVTTQLHGKVELKGAMTREKSEAATGLTAQQLREFGSQRMPNQRTNVTYVSRLQCVKAAVDAQIENVAREHPNTKVGLVVFSNDVIILGDGTQEVLTVAGDKLESWEQLVKIGEQSEIRSSVKDSKEALLAALWNLEEAGQTALGPALHLAVSIAGAGGGSGTGQVVLCTDGLANKGLGSLEGKEEEMTMYYTEVAERAKLKGVSVSVISLEGSDCSLENLAVVTAATGGEMTRVNPLKLTTEFDAILSNPVLATGCFAHVLLHKGLQFRGELDDEDDPTRNWLVRDIGNVTVNTEVSFSYGFRPRSIVDLSLYTEVPFQVQVTYNKPDGGKYMRCVTQSISLTGDRDVAEQSADLKFIGTYAAQRAARYAKRGDYEQAQMEARSANRFLLRNKVNESDLSAWQSNVESMDKVLRGVRQTEEASSSLAPVMRGSAAIETRNRQRKVHRGKADTVSLAIHSQQAKTGRKLWGS